MQIGEEAEPIEVPLPVHPDEVPDEVPDIPEPAVPAEVPVPA